MASTVNSAFDEFMRDYVRLHPDRNKIAKASKGNLIKEIEKLPGDGTFLTLHPEHTSIDYGSFSRKTKTRPLNDIDLMIVLHAEGGGRNEIPGGFEITVSPNSAKQLKLCHDGTNKLNSIKVVNQFVKYLSDVSSYESAIIKRNQEAATLKLSSYEWVYDIVPCFITEQEGFERTFFLIPDGKGNWKPTDPRIDKYRTTQVNGNQKVSVLDIIRIMKYWTKRRTAATMASYFLECMILDYYSQPGDSSTYIDVELPNVFNYIANHVYTAFPDPKGFQGDLNHLTAEERKSIYERARLDYDRSHDARTFENAGNHKDAIVKWRDIFGLEFPPYTA